MASRRAFFAEFKTSTGPGNQTKKLTLTLSYPHCWHLDSHFAVCGNLLAQSTNVPLIFPKTLQSATLPLQLTKKQRTHLHTDYFSSVVFTTVPLKLELFQQMFFRLWLEVPRQEVEESLPVTACMPRYGTWGPACGPVMLSGQWSERVCQTAKLAGDNRPLVDRPASTAIGATRAGHY